MNPGSGCYYFTCRVSGLKTRMIPKSGLYLYYYGIYRKRLYPITKEGDPGPNPAWPNF